MEALCALHSQNICHRNIKAENWKVCQNPSIDIFLASFDYSERTEGDDSSLSGVMGTRLCMAPEIIRGQRYGKKVDVWALGVMAFFLWSGG